MAEEIKCPKCGSEMVVRTAKKGLNAGRKFYVCTRYPECKGEIPMTRESSSTQIVDAVYEALVNRLYALTTDPDMKKEIGVLLSGGWAVAGHIIDNCNLIKKLWGKGNRKKALALVKLFTLHMISHRFRWIEEKERYTEDEKRQARELAANIILTIFEDESEGAVKDFMDMDMQFNYDLDVKKSTWLGNALLLARACEACGQRCVDWNKVTFPATTQAQLLEANAIFTLPMPGDVLEMKVSILHGIGTMREMFEKLTGNR